MTEHTIRTLAKELAGVFYEKERSAEFRAAFPTLKDYMRGLWHENGDIRIDKPGWVYHIAMAKRLLTEMLSQSDAVVSPLMKSRIYDALIDEHSRQRGAKTVTQRIN